MGGVPRLGVETQGETAFEIDDEGCEELRGTARRRQNKGKEGKEGAKDGLTPPCGERRSAVRDVMLKRLEWM